MISVIIMVMVDELNSTSSVKFIMQFFSDVNVCIIVLVYCVCISLLPKTILCCSAYLFGRENPEIIYLSAVAYVIPTVFGSASAVKPDFRQNWTYHSTSNVFALTSQPV